MTAWACGALHACTMLFAIARRICVSGTSSSPARDVAGAEIAALIAEEAFGDLDAPVMRIGGPEVPAMPYNKPQEDWFMPDPAKIAAKMRELAAY